MSVFESQKLYDEFLGNYGLDAGAYNHSVELLDHTFEKCDEIKVVYFGDVMIPVSPAVKNSVKFNNQLYLAPRNAEKELKKHIGMYKGCILDADDLNLFCFTVEEMVLRNLLWPFHLLTIGAELGEKDFYPLADMMEGIVCDTQEAIFAFLQGVLGGNDHIDTDTKRTIEEKKRQTDAWAANAPVEVWASIRRSGKYLDVYASARSTVTSGMVNADYQVHSLLENQFANKKKANMQSSLLDTLEGKLMCIINSYLDAWYARLATLGDIIGQNILRDTICTKKKNFHPYVKSNAIELIDNAPYEVEFFHVATLLDFYEYDFDDLYGDYVSANIINEYVKEKKIDVEDFYYKFYCYFYEIPHAAQHKGLFARIKTRLLAQANKIFERAKANLSPDQAEENCDRVLSAFVRIMDIIPGIADENKSEFLNELKYHYYDVMGCPNLRDRYAKKAR